MSANRCGTARARQRGDIGAGLRLFTSGRRPTIVVEVYFYRPEVPTPFNKKTYQARLMIGKILPLSGKPFKDHPLVV